MLQLADERLAVLVRVPEKFHMDVGEVLVGGVEEGSQSVVGHALDHHLEKGGRYVHVPEV
jgi:hypothetical protein